MITEDLGARSLKGKIKSWEILYHYTRGNCDRKLLDLEMRFKKENIFSAGEWTERMVPDFASYRHLSIVLISWETFHAGDLINLLRSSFENFKYRDSFDMLTFKEQTYPKQRCQGSKLKLKCCKFCLSRTVNDASYDASIAKSHFLRTKNVPGIAC